MRRHTRDDALRTSARYSKDYVCPARVGWISFLGEKFLARETGTIVVFVVGLCRRGTNQLDRCAQLHRAQ